MPPRQERHFQQDFSAGAVPAAAPQMIPENGVQAIRNGFLNEDGSIYRRGGARYFSVGVLEGVPGDRVNRATNPRGAIDTTGWTDETADVFTTGALLPTSGLPTDILTTFQVSSLAPAWRVRLPFSVAAAEVITASLYARGQDSGNVAYLRVLDENLEEIAVSEPIEGPFRRYAVTFQAAAVDIDIYWLALDGDVAANPTFTAVLIEEASAPGVYFDGDYANAVWSGTPHASTSSNLVGSGLTFLWAGLLPAGRRELVATATTFGVLDANRIPIDIGGAGLPFPKPVAHIGGYLFIGGGFIYAGSRQDAPYSVGTVSVTEDSAIVTGSGTSWLANVDAGMLLQLGDDRVYSVASVNSDTSLTLNEPYRGATDTGQSYVLHSIYEITVADPYELSDIYAEVKGRLFWTAGRFLRFAPIHHGDVDDSRNGLPDNHAEWVDTDEHEFPQELVGIAEIIGTLIVFSRAGTWTLQGAIFDIVGPDGTPRHTIDKLSDHVLVDGAGLAYWEQRLIAPFTDGVYLVDGTGEPLEISQNIGPRYEQRLKANARAGQAAVHHSHYVLPLISASAEMRDVLAVQLDRRSFDRRRRQTSPWSWMDGHGAEVCAFISTQLSHTRLLAAGANPATQIHDCSEWWNPSNTSPALDPDGSAFEGDIITRAFPTGEETENMLRWFRPRYELTGDGMVNFAWTDGSALQGLPLWNEENWNEFNWAAPETASFTALPTVGGPSDGRTPLRMRIPKPSSGRSRMVRHVAWRVRFRGACQSAVLRQIEFAVRPSKAVRR